MAKKLDTRTRCQFCSEAARHELVGFRDEDPADRQVLFVCWRLQHYKKANDYLTEKGYQLRKRVLP